MTMYDAVETMCGAINESNEMGETSMSTNSSQWANKSPNTTSGSNSNQWGAEHRNDSEWNE